MSKKLKIENKEIELNKLLEGINAKVCIIETSELYGEDDYDFYDQAEIHALRIEHNDKYIGEPMYEAYVEDEDEEQISETTGRHCCLDLVFIDLEGEVNTLLEEKIKTDILVAHVETDSHGGHHVYIIVNNKKESFEVQTHEMAERVKDIFNDYRTTNFEMLNNAIENYQICYAESR